ncbi:pseudouridine synthase [Acetivibrio mesophilus]|uniref:Pseudouridine synthase n=1 Tax=Acetivibrio mesophilus TaxID=2487273 RepID=A0A4Q0I266_9FIRM|nr:pseudouridine synthase [Acetivibrio mesophilus]ODM25460.1 pseudouridine synthase [Clostridium sp. Bc-iso-3]RXE58310.1 rRNA pseudouridine synthase [Acetivibrio mesophilus]HHV28866.1 rRNA pseudouridine synthase [Clostridium sp.]
MEEIRLQKYIAECGVASRRKSEELISQGRVRVNGETVTQMGRKVSLNDVIEVDGKQVKMEERKVYIALNKPVGYISSARDQFGRKTVLDLVKDIKERVFPVGRLDYDTSGLLLLSNDGDFTYKLTHPKHEIKKVYEADLMGIPSKDDIIRFEQGLWIDDYLTSPANLQLLESNGKTSKVKITIHEGKNRQVRKMCDKIGCPVIKLKRISIGEVSLGKLNEGSWRSLTDSEINSFFNY